ncbi:MAG: hypothetical protein RLZZ262_996 [Bacteroidota bacterium]
MFLQAINNQLEYKGTYPTALKTAKIIPIPKQKPGEFRPISILPSVSKIVEYKVQMRLRKIVEPKLPPNQFGCRPGHSTTQALLRLMHYAAVSAGNDLQFGVILYDFVKAYDRVPKHIIIAKMIELNIPAFLTNFVHEWLTNRRFTVQYQMQKPSLREQTNGIPQGSSLSVLYGYFLCTTSYLDSTHTVPIHTLMTPSDGQLHQTGAMSKWVHGNN